MDKDELRELVHKYNELDLAIHEWEVEQQQIKEYLRDDPVASYRVTTRRTTASLEIVEGEKKVVKKSTSRKMAIMTLYNTKGEIASTITRKQAEVLLMGRGIKTSVLDEKGKVRTTYIIDELAESFGMTEQEFLDHLDSIHEMQEKLNDLDVMIENAKADQKELGVNVGHHFYAAPQQKKDNNFGVGVAIVAGLLILNSRYDK
jgi:hypothetical protein